MRLVCPKLCADYVRLYLHDDCRPVVAYARQYELTVFYDVRNALMYPYGITNSGYECAGWRRSKTERLCRVYRYQGYRPVRTILQVPAGEKEVQPESRGREEVVAHSVSQFNTRTFCDFIRGRLKRNPGCRVHTRRLIMLLCRATKPLDITNFAMPFIVAGLLY